MNYNHLYYVAGLYFTVVNLNCQALLKDIRGFIQTGNLKKLKIAIIRLIPFVRRS